MTARLLEDPTARPMKQLKESRAMFIRRLGREMSSYWGSTARWRRVHALLYVATGPVCTDDVMGAFAGFARQRIDEPALAGRLGAHLARIHIRGDRKGVFHGAHGRVADV